MPADYNDSGTPRGSRKGTPKSSPISTPSRDRPPGGVEDGYDEANIQPKPPEMPEMTTTAQPLLYKEDWPEAQKHIEAWWAGSSLGRPMLAFAAPRDKPMDPLPLPARPQTPQGRHLDPDWVYTNQENFLRSHRMMAEQYPVFSLNIGPGSLALYLGSEPGFSDETIWFEPCLPEDEDELEATPLPSFDPENPWWEKHLELVRIGAERAKGKGYMTMPDLVEDIDILAAMRGPEDTLTDLYDRPEWVKAWVKRIDELYFEYFDRMYELIKDERGGNAFTAFQLWAPGKTAKIQCDFSYMIGHEMFAEFVAPGLGEICKKLDYSVYHLDGPNCIQHAKHLVKIPELNAIQWTPGAGVPRSEDPRWFDFYHEVRDAGKSLELIVGSEEAAKTITKELGGPDGLFFWCFHKCQSEYEAEEFIKRSYDWA
jgi:5-methyltetrahydrofolate--homocysteine methyltransferase